MTERTGERFDNLEAAVRYANSLLPPDDPAGMALEAIGGEWGSYEGGRPLVEWQPDGRTGKLARAITYHRQDGTDWPVPLGAWLDGASIPPVLWSLICGPQEGRYRDASIIHDHFCITKSRRWQDTHRMFHDAMRCSGVGKARAAVMFYAVWRFGPDWPDPDALENLAATSRTVRPIDVAAIEAFSRDAEAIVEHRLDRDEVAALAEARGAGIGENALEGLADPAGSARAALLVVAGGNGTAQDVATVAARAAALPSYVVDRFLKKKIRIVACRGSVTDFETSLRDVVPRGWESLKVRRTWDSVPGAYFNDRKRVVIATVDGAVPDKASGLHGSDDLVVHEALHGYDYVGEHKILGHAAFRDAREQDLGGLSDYERQDGQAGLEETFAETGAQFCASAGALGRRCPNLAAFWQEMPLPGVASAASTALESLDVERAPLGTVTRATDGALHFDLRAEGAGGAIGHARLTVEPGEPEHQALDARLFPKGASLESVGETTVLFYP